MEIGDFFVFHLDTIDTKIFVSLLNHPTCYEIFQIENVALFLARLSVRDYITDCEGNGYNIRMSEGTYSLSYHPGVTFFRDQNNLAVPLPMTKEDRKIIARKYKFRRSTMLKLIEIMPKVHDEKEMRLLKEVYAHIKELQDELEKRW